MEIEEKRRQIIKYVIIGIVISLVIWFVIAIFSNRRDDDLIAKKYIQQASSYTIPDSDITSYRPVINLEGEDTEDVNDQIKEDYNQAIKGGVKQFNYQYSINDDVFSLVTITNQLDEDDNPYSTFKTYNFHLEDNRLLEDEELLAMFQKTSEDVSNSFEEVLTNYYQEEIDNYFLSSDDCDFNCFLSLREVNSYIGGNHLYVEDNTLKFFHSFKIFSNLGEEEFYRKESFLYTVK